MKDGKITLNRAVKCYKPCRIEQNDKRFEASKKFFDKYGFHFEEIWNLDDEVAYFILIHLIHLRDCGCGYPSNFVRDSEDCKEDFKRWKTQLDKMIRGFYLYLVIDFPNKKERKIIDKGRKLFHEHFSSLWD